MINNQYAFSLPTLCLAGLLALATFPIAVAISKAEEPPPLHPYNAREPLLLLPEASAEPETPKASAAPETPVAKPTPPPKLEPAKTKPRVPKKKVIVERLPANRKAKSGPSPQKPRKSVSLSIYAVVAQRYYKEVRCRTMSQTELVQLYDWVVWRHKAALAEHRASDVKAMLETAKARADSSICAKGERK